MRKTSVITVTVLACLAALPAAAAWAGKPAGRGAARVAMVSCKSSPDAASRRATFLSAMRSTDGKDVLEMRFALFQRLPGQRSFKRVANPDLEAVRSAGPGTRLFKQRQTVTGLLAPAAYKVAVRYRWARGGKVVGRAKRTSRTCQQKVARPDLVARSLTITPLPDDGTGTAKARYELTVANRGKGNAEGFEISFGLGTRELFKGTVPTLGPGASITLKREERACPAGRSLVARIDPGDLIPESREDNNVVTADCPAA